VVLAFNFPSLKSASTGQRWQQCSLGSLALQLRR